MKSKHTIYHRNSTDSISSTVLDARGTALNFTELTAYMHRDIKLITP